jgi:hypothetical protein
MANRQSFNEHLRGYALVLFLVVVTMGLILVHAGRALNLGFPLLATSIGGTLIIYRRSVYVAYVWWIWLFTPEVRRLVDFQSGYHSVSPVMVTPILVTSFALIAVLRRPQFLLRQSMAPFLLYGLVMVYALLVGILGGEVLPAGFEFANWILPVSFALFIMMNPDDFVEIRDALLSAIVSGLLMISLYGLYQFFHFPPWDAYWLTQSNLASEGLGIAEQVRIFGPLNSSGPYAIVLMASLIFILVAKGPVRIVAGAVGIPAFGLSLVRSAWLGWALAAFYILSRVGGKTRLWILVIGGLLTLGAIPLITVGPVAGVLASRFATLDNVQQDRSFQTRERLYENTTEAAFSNPIGIGFGRIGVSAKLTTGQTSTFDSGLLLVPYEFGWVGGATFLWVISRLTWKVFVSTSRSKDSIAIAAAGLFFALIAQNVFASTFDGVLGIALWIGAALSLGPISFRRRITNSGPVSNFHQTVLTADVLILK